MAEFLDKVSAFLSGLSADQYVALALVIVAVIVALNVAKKALSIAVSAFGVLATLYFIQPELYQKAINALTILWDKIVAAL